MATEQAVIITGASSGIGRACALHMDQLGWRVFGGVRKESDAAELRAAASERLRPLILDVTDSASIRVARDAVAEATGESAVSGLVNNAGIAYGGPVELIDMVEFRRTFDVNFFGAVAMIQAFLPLLRAGRGRIVNVSSVSGWVASPFLSPYSTSKFALEALSDALRVELRPWNLQVSVVEPGAIATPIWTKGVEVLERLRLLDRESQPVLEPYSAALESTAAQLRPHGISAMHVAKAVAHALTSRWPRTRYAVGRDAKVVSIFRHLPDRVRDRFFARRLPKW